MLYVLLMRNSLLVATNYIYTLLLPIIEAFWFFASSSNISNFIPIFNININII